TLKLTNMNRLRYRVQVGTSIKLTDGPDLSVANFIFSFADAKTTKPQQPPSQPATTDQQGSQLAAPQSRRGQKPPPKPPDSITPRIASVDADLDVDEAEIQPLVDSARSAAQNLTTCKAFLVTLVKNSDDVLASTGGLDSLVKQIGDEKSALAT